MVKFSIVIFHDSAKQKYGMLNSVMIDVPKTSLCSLVMKKASKSKPIKELRAIWQAMKSNGGPPTVTPLYAEGGSMELTKLPNKKKTLKKKS